MDIENLPKSEVQELDEHINELKIELKSTKKKLYRELDQVKNRLSYAEGQLTGLMKHTYG